MNYLLRNVPEGLWRQAKAAAALRGVTVRELLLSCLRDLAEARPSNIRPDIKESVPRKAARHLKHK
jgi:hypothetical protein